VEVRRRSGAEGTDVRPGADLCERRPRFDSLDAIRAFAGDDYPVPVLEPEARALLSRYDHRALHFDTAAFQA
jgi:hypothetical protein